MIDGGERSKAGKVIKLKVWDDSLSSRLDGEMRARIIGVVLKCIHLIFSLGFPLEIFCVTPH